MEIIHVEEEKLQYYGKGGRYQREALIRWDREGSSHSDARATGTG